jgi:hypothetical protein
MDVNKKAVADLLTWVNAPTNTNDLFVRLEAMNFTDLIFTSLCSDRNAARIAWMEFANRRGLLHFTFRLVEVDGGVALDCSSEPVPIVNRAFLGRA